MTGAVIFATAIGGRPIGSNEYLLGYQIPAQAIEYALADTLGLVRATAQKLGTGDYDVEIGIDLSSAAPVHIYAPDPVIMGRLGGSATSVHYQSVRASISTDVDDETFRGHVYELALDCVNQGGITHPSLITAPTNSAKADRSSGSPA